MMENQDMEVASNSREIEKNNNDFFCRAIGVGGWVLWPRAW